MALTFCKPQRPAVVPWTWRSMGKSPSTRRLRASMARPRTWQMPVLGWMPWIRGAATWSPVRGPQWKRRHRRNRRARWHWRCRWNRRDYWRGWTIGAGGAAGPDASPNVRPDAGSEAKDASSGDTVAPTDLGSSEASAGADALVDSRGPDVPADAPSASPDTVPVSTVDAPARDVPIDSLPAACAVNGCAWANPWQAPTGTLGSFSGLALAQDGTTLWAAGQVNATFNFGTDANPVTNLYTGPLPAPGTQPSNDIVLLKLDPQLA